jgi:hypothetical protein
MSQTNTEMLLSLRDHLRQKLQGYEQMMVELYVYPHQSHILVVYVIRVPEPLTRAHTIQLQPDTDIVNIETIDYEAYGKNGNKIDSHNISICRPDFLEQIERVATNMQGQATPTLLAISKHLEELLRDRLSPAHHRELYQKIYKIDIYTYATSQERIKVAIEVFATAPTTMPYHAGTCYLQIKDGKVGLNICVSQTAQRQLIAGTSMLRGEQFYDIDEYVIDLNRPNALEQITQHIVTNVTTGITVWLSECEYVKAKTNQV